ncbi:hypothetical protein RD792_007370 [Penstemon davidsonii]|uniref:Kinesin motor domain-containing protein n=1 Tax=Penstemon davidsonii TaxID=160366 RepID=A0ABR0D7B4_9LAMI|nr:hypothetical protein RD792_007370 [Penstemon davidsonii]
MVKSNSEFSENSRFFGTISASVPLKNLLPKSTRRSKVRLDGENIAPINSNIQFRDPPISASISFSKNSPLKPKVRDLKEDLTATVVPQQLPGAPDPPVKVVVRIRPANGTVIRKISEDTISIGERNYRFDSVFDSNSTQGDVYELVGAPLVKDALSGYNTSLVAYGQTGSGKSYTMWGPFNSMVEAPSVSGLQGVVPRIFQDLFSKIQKDQENNDDKLINYQCRCSFLEVYDGKISDLLDPTQRKLELKDDAKNGFYVENLTEEYVTSYEDVTQILIKGLSNRKIGATSKNSKSSRSHIMFTCIIESWCKVVSANFNFKLCLKLPLLFPLKHLVFIHYFASQFSYSLVLKMIYQESSSKCFGTSKTSRISLVDLAGFDRNTLDDASKQHAKEGKYIKKSTSQLGHLVNIIAKGRQSDKAEEVPYRSSCLTHLLRESFGGNAKLSIICAISPDEKSNSETLSTLRFGLRAKLMKNEPLVNEITEDDVDGLSDQIRQLKEELMRAKSSECNSLSINHGYFSGRKVRESVNQLRISLNRSLILPRIDRDSEEDLCINEDDVKQLRLQIDNISSSHEEIFKEDSQIGENTLIYSAEGTCEHYLSCSDESENEVINSDESQTELSNNECHQSTLLQDPVLSESPKIKNSHRKSLAFLSNHPSNQDDAVETSKNLDVLRQSHQPDHIKSSLRSSRIIPGPTESIAASLHRGLHIIDYHQKNPTATRSSVSFSFEHLALKQPCLSIDKANASAQTSPEEGKSSDPPPVSFVCMKCQGRGNATSNEVEDSLKTCMVVADGSSHGAKDIEKDLALAIQREKELSSLCKEQAAQIEHLNQLLEKYNCETHQNVISSYRNSSNFSDRENQLQPIYEDEHEKYYPPNSENKLLTWKSDENHEPEFIKEKCEIKEVQENSNHSMQKSFSFEGREALLRENEILRNKLHSYNDAAPTRISSDKLRSYLCCYNPSS